MGARGAGRSELFSAPCTGGAEALAPISVAERLSVASGLDMGSSLVRCPPTGSFVHALPAEWQVAACSVGRKRRWTERDRQGTPAPTVGGAVTHATALLETTRPADVVSLRGEQALLECWLTKPSLHQPGSSKLGYEPGREYSGRWARDPGALPKLVTAWKRRRHVAEVRAAARASRCRPASARDRPAGPHVMSELCQVVFALHGLARLESVVRGLIVVNGLPIICGVRMGGSAPRGRSLAGNDSGTVRK